MPSSEEDEEAAAEAKETALDAAAGGSTTGPPVLTPTGPPHPVLRETFTVAALNAQIDKVLQSMPPEVNVVEFGIVAEKPHDGPAKVGVVLAVKLPEGWAGYAGGSVNARWDLVGELGVRKAWRKR